MPISFLISYFGKQKTYTSSLGIAKGWTGGVKSDQLFIIIRKNNDYDA